jgi:deoxycytidylate deaminase
MADAATMRHSWHVDPTRPELIIGLIGALGAKIRDVEVSLRDRLIQLGYHVPGTIKLSHLLDNLEGATFNKLRAAPGGKAHVSEYMDAGNELRAQIGRSDAMALLGVSRIRATRAEIGIPEENAADGVAFIIDSLKHPAEVVALRRLYGSSFIAIGVFNNRDDRIESAANRLATYYGRGIGTMYRDEAEKLVVRDENEQGVPHGQHVSEAFALADVIVGKNEEREYAKKRDLKESVVRFVDLLFGDWRNTPTTDETGMHYAQGARYRSASMARQVGAAILRSDGSVIATGMNDVPSAGGGLYGDHSKTDARDHALEVPKDSSDFYKREVLIELFDALFELKLLNVEGKDYNTALVDALIASKALKSTRLMATIDYVRAVHAEMAALMDSARHGVAVSNCTLFTTTFPCHDCSKHIVAAGIGRVVFVEPYTKSLTSELFLDSIAIDNPAESGKVQFVPFIGVMPRRYGDLFAMRGDRKGVNGLWKEWTPQEARPVLGDYTVPSAARILSEDVAVRGFNDLLDSKGLMLSTDITKEKQ